MTTDSPNTAKDDGVPSKRGGKRGRHIRVPVHPHEGEGIDGNARAAGLSTAAYLRNVGLGYQPRALVDHEQIQEMLRINGDLGRLGGLLKLWLSDDKKLAEFPPGQAAAAVRSALHQIETSQDELRAVVKLALRAGDKQS